MNVNTNKYLTTSEITHMHVYLVLRRCYIERKVDRVELLCDVSTSALDVTAEVNVITLRSITIKPCSFMHDNSDEWSDLRSYNMDAIACVISSLN